MGYCVVLYFPKLLVFDKVLGLGSTDTLSRFASVTSNLVVSFYFAKRGFENAAKDYQAVNMSDEKVRAIVAETLAAQQRQQHASIDAMVLKVIASTLSSFGIEEDDRRELKADFQHLRRWRRSAEQAESYAFKAVITVIVSGLVGVAWLGVKVVLGK